MRKMKKGVFGRLLDAVDELLFPAQVQCLCCERALEEESGPLCGACMLALDELACQQAAREEDEAFEPPPGLDWVHAAYPYDGQARRLIHRLKYDRIRAAADILARGMVDLPAGEEEILVPVPTDKSRERRRGFNQATLLAQAIGRELGMEVSCALMRTQRRRPQTGLSAAQRRENLRACMAVKPSAKAAVSGRRVLLVDDVCTTGATLCEAARTLHEAGALHVSAFVCARAWDAAQEAQDPFALPDKAQNT